MGQIASLIDSIQDAAFYFPIRDYHVLSWTLATLFVTMLSVALKYCSYSCCLEINNSCTCSSIIREHWKPWFIYNSELYIWLMLLVRAALVVSRFCNQGQRQVMVERCSPDTRSPPYACKVMWLRWKLKWGSLETRSIYNLSPDWVPPEVLKDCSHASFDQR